MELRVCKRCGIEKDLLTAFHKSGRGTTRLWTCAACIKVLRPNRDNRSKATRSRQYSTERDAHPDGRTENSFLSKFRRYRLTLDQYHAMAERQDFLCAVCGEEPTPQHPKKVAIDNYVVDHDHTTGVVRELTCWQCNSALGLLKDDPVTARKAADYLEKHHARRALTA